jgi:hypothetical protein
VLYTLPEPLYPIDVVGRQMSGSRALELLYKRLNFSQLFPNILFMCGSKFTVIIPHIIGMCKLFTDFVNSLNLNSVNQLIFVMVKCGVLFEVRTEFLNNI